MSLVAFLKTGALPQLEMKATKNYVRSKLGDPDDVSIKKKPEIWKYGSVQLSFWAGVLAGVSIYFDSERSFPECLQVESLFEEKLAYEEFETYARSNGVMLTAEQSTTFQKAPEELDRTPCLALGQAGFWSQAGVQVIFEVQRDGTSWLDSMHMFKQERTR